MDALEHAEKTLIRAVVSQCGGDIARAAKIFGTTPAALCPLAEELGLIPTAEPTIDRKYGTARQADSDIQRE
jgi:transcriptional regulator with GAF, ATPase, and Fis domain